MSEKYFFTKRAAVNEKLNVDKVYDEKVKAILLKRLREFGGDAKKAFSNIESDPIWLNKAKGLQIKSVHVKSNQSLIPLRRETDGTPKDFVKPNSNDHADIYVDENGKLHEQVVSFFDAVQGKERVVGEQWRHLFSIKRYEYFVVPGKHFNPFEIDLENPKNRVLVSKHLFFVQKISAGHYLLRLHSDPTNGELKELQNMNWIRITKLSNFIGCVKVTLDKAGDLRILKKITLD